MLSRILCISAALLALAVSARRTDPPPGALGGDGSPENPHRMAPGSRGSSGDAKGLELHRRVPGYAGIYFDPKHDRLVIRFKRGQPLPPSAAARKAVSEVMNIPEVDIERAALEEADRDMAELIELKDRISTSCDGEMSGLGIDVRAGRVVIGVRDRKTMAGTEAMLKRLGVPPDAVEIVEIPPIEIKRNAQLLRETTESSPR